MARVIFRKDKYEEDMINKFGMENFLLMKLNERENDAWPYVLDGKDITDSIKLTEQNGQTIYNVNWKSVDDISFSANLFCFVLENWCDFVDD